MFKTISRGGVDCMVWTALVLLCVYLACNRVATTTTTTLASDWHLTMWTI